MMKIVKKRKMLSLLLASMLLFFTVSPALETEAVGGIPADDEQRVIITFKDKAKVDSSKIKGKIKREHKRLPSIAAALSSAEINKLKKDASIESIEPDVQVKSTIQTMDWGVSVVQATYAWNAGYTGQGVKVAVLDSGISLQHHDLIIAGGASFVDYTTSYDDDFGHGTHVAGIIGAKNNDTGVVGVAPNASLYAVKVLDAGGAGYVSDIIAGMDWALDNKMDIINMSFGTNTDSPALRRALDEAYGSGLLLVAAAGNAGNADGTGNTVQYPAKYGSVIAVGAVDSNRQRATFSSTGKELEVVAPGVGIQSTDLNNGVRTLSGTSMAAPFVAGELALLKQAHPSLSNIQLRTLLDESAIDLGENGKDLSFGYGQITLTGVSASAPSTTIPINNVPNSVNADVYLNAQMMAQNTGQSVKIAWHNSTNNWQYADATGSFPSLVNAKSFAIDVHEEQGNMYVHYWNNTVKTFDGGDITHMFPSLVNAKSIAVFGGQGYALYTNNTVKTLNYNPMIGLEEVDATSMFPSLVNAKAITFDSSGQEYVFYTDNTVKQLTSDQYGNPITVDVTSMFPNLQNVRAVTFDQHIGIYLAYFDQSPTLNVTFNNQTAYKTATNNTLTLSGTVSDPDNDNVTISATVAGVAKTTTVSNTSTVKNWTLQWNAVSDNLPGGTYTNIPITANDTLWGSGSVTFTGNLVVDSLPNVPIALTPGSATSTTPTLIAGLTPTLSWTFADPDAGDYQGAYNVQIFNAAGTTLVHDTGWVNGSSNSFTVPVNKLTRGTVYSWKVAVKDSQGATSAYSPLYYFKTNNLPNASITSYTDGQQLSDNMLSFAWTYTDADGQAQVQYHLQGSRDNWATIGYDSGVRSGNATNLTLPALPDGTWSFKVKVFDGMEWSNAALRSNLQVPNAYEPNDTHTQAFTINYNTPYSSNITASTDVDFFKYVAPATGLDRLTMTVPTGLNYDIYIYDSTMNAIAASVQGAGLQENVLYEVTAGKTYYVKVVGVGGHNSTTTPYTLKVNAYTLKYKTDYQYDSNGNLTTKTTTMITN